MTDMSAYTRKGRHRRERPAYKLLQQQINLLQVFLAQRTGGLLEL